KPAAREDETDKRLRRLMAWSGKGLFVWLLFLASFFLAAWFLRPSPQPQLAGRTKPATGKTRDKTDKRWGESKSAEGDTTLAPEELMAAENAELAFAQVARPNAPQVVVVPEENVANNNKNRVPVVREDALGNIVIEDAPQVERGTAQPPLFPQNSTFPVDPD